MSTAEQSLIAPPPEQPSLLPVAADSFFTDVEAKGEFTGERLFQQRPDTYKAVVVLLGQGLGVIRIGKLLSVSPNTVLAVRGREGATIDIVKEHLARVAHDGATLASESIVMALADRAKNAHMMNIRDLKDLAVVYGILVQNGQLLAGQPTARIDVTDIRQPGHDDYNKLIASLPVTNVTDVQTIHSPGEKSALKETPRIEVNDANGLPIDLAQDGAPAIQTDSQSEGQQAQTPDPQMNP